MGSCSARLGQVLLWHSHPLWLPVMTLGPWVADSSGPYLVHCQTQCCPPRLYVQQLRPLNSNDYLTTDTGLCAGERVVTETGKSALIRLTVRTDRCVLNQYSHIMAVGTRAMKAKSRGYGELPCVVGHGSLSLGLAGEQRESVG